MLRLFIEGSLSGAYGFFVLRSPNRTILSGAIPLESFGASFGRLGLLEVVEVVD